MLVILVAFTMPTMGWHKTSYSQRSKPISNAAIRSLFPWDIALHGFFCGYTVVFPRSSNAPMFQCLPILCLHYLVSCGKHKSNHINVKYFHTIKLLNFFSWGQIITTYLFITN